MNFVTSNAVFCLFPNDTFNGRLLRNRQNNTRRAREAVSKYLTRGFVEAQDLHGRALRLQDRYLHDPRSWVLDPTALHDVWCERGVSFQVPIQVET